MEILNHFLSAIVCRFSPLLPTIKENKKDDLNKLFVVVLIHLNLRVRVPSEQLVEH